VSDPDRRGDVPDDGGRSAEQQGSSQDTPERRAQSGPRLVAGKGGGRRINLWLILVAALLLIVVIALVWYELSRREALRPLPAPSPSSSFAWNGSWARTDGPGGGLVVAGANPVYGVTFYDAAGREAGSVKATATADGMTLRLTLPPQFSLAGPYGALTATITAQPPDTATMTVGGAGGGRVSIGLTRVPALSPAPGASSPSPFAQPSSEAGASPTPATSASSDADLLRHEMIAAIGALQAGIEAWAADHSELYPPPPEVRREGGVAAYVDPWPSDPWSPGQPLTPGLDPGGYVYDQLDGGLDYRLTGVLDKGTFVVP
jgi:hypothetical protein